ARKTVHVLEEHAGAILDVQWSADGGYLATFDQDGSVIRVWRTTTGTLLHTLKALDKIIGWSTRGHTLIARDIKETIQFRDAETGASVKSIAISDAPLSYRSFVSQAKQLDISALSRGEGRWESGAPADEVSLPEHPSTSGKWAWSHDGKTLATGSR